MHTISEKKKNLPASAVQDLKVITADTNACGIVNIILGHANYKQFVQKLNHQKIDMCKSS